MKIVDIQVIPFRVERKQFIMAAFWRRTKSRRR